jgi:hypothetical protein
MGISVLGNGNEKPSIDVALAVETKEIYEVMSRIPDAIRYKE